MFYPNLDARVRYVLHESFHSGTLNTVSRAAKSFFAEAKRRGIPVFLTGVTKGDAYAGVAAFEELCITPLYHIAPVAAYVKLWMLSLVNDRVTADMLQAPLAGDMAV